MRCDNGFLHLSLGWERNGGTVMKVRHVVAGLFMGFAGGAVASCTADVGPVAGASEIGQEQGTEEVGQSQEALKKKKKPKAKHKRKACKNKGHHHIHDDTQAAGDCGEDVTICDDCFTNVNDPKTCCTFHQVMECTTDSEESFSETCECIARLSCSSVLCA
jgi:hypothetical protein